MRALVMIVLGVWALFWLGCAASAVFGQGDVMGMIAFAVIGGLPWLWVSEIVGKASPSAE
jgi:hypothetical protein